MREAEQTKMRASENVECVAQVASSDAIRRAFAFILARQTARPKLEIPIAPLSMLSLTPLSPSASLSLVLCACERNFKNIVACF